MLRNGAAYFDADISQCLALAEGSASLVAKVTIVVSTSVSDQNPSTECLQSVLASFNVIPGLQGCRRVIVCDRPVLDAKVSDFKKGFARASDIERYEQFVKRVQAFCKEGSSMWTNTSCIVLESRHGFGHSVGVALNHVCTPFVLVVQHDRCFVRSVPLPKVIEVMETHPEEIKYVGFPVNNRSTYREPGKIMSSHNGFQVRPIVVDGLQLLPLLLWYDSTHVASADHYRYWVLPQVCQGEFFEEQFGQEEVRVVIAKGMDSHRQYGNFLLMDPVCPHGYSVLHLEALRDHRQGNYGTDNLQNLRRMLCDRLAGRHVQSPNEYRVRHRLQQRLGIVRRLAEIGALPASLKSVVHETLVLAAACGFQIPSWMELHVM